ncbi:acyl-CoA thioesterase [Marixanthomonas ophiurae]|uniref:acyl-CoA thioesterase n=1 Tax=Marixanthomonas ophiurae TaxID=387659 RepID=UPI001EFD6893|nr:thioesterase family protein [Marixanthomonas ophiurae]
MNSVFSYTFQVPKSAIDVNGHVNNITYLEWCLDIAEKHWFSKAPKETHNTYFWVVLNHFIEYKNPSFEGEELQIETWVTSAEGVKSERHYKIFRKSDDKVMVTAKTLWCFVELKSQKPTRITEEIRNLFL